MPGINFPSRCVVDLVSTVAVLVLPCGYRDHCYVICGPDNWGNFPSVPVVFPSRLSFIAPSKADLMGEMVVEQDISFALDGVLRTLSNVENHLGFPVPIVIAGVEQLPIVPEV
jgi:hypothetical protein